MKPTVYVETSVISYLTARPSRDVILLGHQLATQKWWSSAGANFELFVSQAVVAECGKGDPAASAARLAVIGSLKQLAITNGATEIAGALIAEGAVPRRFPEDVLHIAIAAAHGMTYLVSWNFSHITNPTKWMQIDRVCRSFGFAMPMLCSPEQLDERDGDE